ncbi:MAG: APC family permease [Pseudomonadota bacterium]
MNDHQTPRQEKVTLQRRIGPLSLLFAGISSIIGSGWLFGSMFAAQMAGPAAIISWVIGGAIMFVIAIVYAETVSMLPAAGVIARIPFFTHGSLAGFTAGWLCLVTYLAATPIEVIAVLDYASNYVPSLTTTEEGERVLTIEGLIIAALLLAVFTAINLKGAHWLATANSAITVWKLLIPSIVPIALFVFAFDGDHFSDYSGFAPYGTAGIFAAVSSGGVLYALSGFRAMLDLAGEARNPQRDIPLALMGAIGICTLLYLVLQIAFIGAVPESYLAMGWSGISEAAPGGPFAAIVGLLGLKWLALLIYIDAAVSPGGTGLAYSGATARLDYGMAKNGHLPKIFARLNRNGVPAWALLANLVVGLIMLAPFPNWREMISFITSAAHLSLAFGPISLIALRLQMPDRPRPFRIPFAMLTAALAMVLISWVLYWTGWNTNWKALIAVAVGVAVFATLRWLRGQRGEPANVRQMAWFAPYLALIATTSYLGNYGGGIGLVPEWLDMAIIAVGALAIFALAIRLRLPDEDAKALVAQTNVETQTRGKI